MEGNEFPDTDYAGVAPVESRPDDPDQVIDLAWRAESARPVGTLTRMTRDMSLADDLVQEEVCSLITGANSLLRRLRRMTGPNENDTL